MKPKTTIIRVIVALVLLTVLWYCRSFFPIFFLNDRGMEISFTLPDNIDVSIWTKYSSSHCKVYALGTDSWNNMTRRESYTAKKIGDNRYQAKIYYEDSSLCQWKLNQIYWEIGYQDVAKAHPNAAKAQGGGGVLQIHTHLISMRDII